MQRNPVDVVVALFQYFTIPFQIRAHSGTAGAARDELQRAIHRTHLAGSVGSLQSIFRRRHVADLPRTVHLVAYAPVLHVVGGGDAVFAAQFAPARSFLDVAVFNQSGGLLRRAGAKIQAHERRGSHRVAPGDEFIGAELICFEGIPGFVQNPGEMFLGSYTIQPVVAVYYTSARLADDGDSEMFNFLKDILAETVRIGKFRAWFVDTSINCATKMFQERSEEISIERGKGAARVQIDASSGIGTRGWDLRCSHAAEHEVRRAACTGDHRLSEKPPPLCCNHGFDPPELIFQLESRTC